MNGVTQHLRFFESASIGLQAELGLLLETGRLQNDYPLIWQTSQSLVVPASFAARPGFQNAAAASCERGWPVATRATGGGTTPQGSGILNVCLAFQAASRPSIHEAYRIICDPLRGAFEDMGMRTTCRAVPGSFCDGEFNIVHSGRKLVGTAQRWRPASSGVGHRILVHALILYSTDVCSVVQAINAFHQDFELDVPIISSAHTTVASAGGNLSEGAFAGLLAKHIDTYSERRRRNSEDFPRPELFAATDIAATA